MYFVEADGKANVPAICTRPKTKLKTKKMPMSERESRVWGILTRKSRYTTLRRADMAP